MTMGFLIYKKTNAGNKIRYERMNPLSCILGRWKGRSGRGCYLFFSANRAREAV